MTYFLYAFLGALCCYFSCVHLLPHKMPNCYKTIIFLYIWSTTHFFNAHFGQAATFITYFGAVTMIYFMTKKDLLSLCCVLFGYLYSVTFNYLFMFLAAFFLKTDIETMLSSDMQTILFSLIYCIYCGISTMYLGRILTKKLKNVPVLTDRRLLLVLLIDLCVMAGLFILNFSYGEHLGYNYGVVAINGVLFLLLFLFTVYLMHFIYQTAIEKKQTENRQEQLKNLGEYAKNLERSLEVMRKFKHDHINILSTMYGFMECGDMPGLTEYYQKKIMPLSRSISESGPEVKGLSYIMCIELKSLLSSKVIYSVEMGIHTEVELTEPIEELYMDSLDLCRIMGVFLDNAIEAAVSTEEKELRLCIFRKDGYLQILVRNSTAPIPVAVSELNKAGVSGKGSERGIGLSNVSELLQKYSHIIWNTSYEPPYFIQHVMITYHE